MSWPPALPHPGGADPGTSRRRMNELVRLCTGRRGNGLPSWRIDADIPDPSIPHPGEQVECTGHPGALMAREMKPFFPQGAVRSPSLIGVGGGRHLKLRLLAGGKLPDRYLLPPHRRRGWGGPGDRGGSSPSGPQINGVTGAGGSVAAPDHGSASRR